jgi:hypothetical protein
MPQTHFRTRRRPLFLCVLAALLALLASTQPASAADGRPYTNPLKSADPLSPSSWTKKSTPVFHRSDANGVYGPGHNGFFTSPDGTENWIVYHANSSSSGGCGNGRTTRAQKFTWNSDGTPNFGTPVALGTSLPDVLPAGRAVRLRGRLLRVVQLRRALHQALQLPAVRADPEHGDGQGGRHLLRAVTHQP